MKKILCAFTTLIILLTGTVVYSTGYNVLVIPSGLAGMSKHSVIGSTDIEEVLTYKIIKQLESANIAYAPTMSTLKISIKNNSGFIPKAVNPINNVKIISKSYGVPKVILVSSKIEVQNASMQKSFWNKLELPVITPPESNIRIVTTVTLYDTSSDDILWSNVFYKNINCIGNGINNYNSNDSKLKAVNIYYDQLAQKIIEEVKDSKETRAIMVITKPAAVKDSPKTKVIHVQNHNKESKPIDTKTNITKSPAVFNTPKPNLKMHDSNQKPKQETIFNKVKNTVQLKYDTVKQEYENNKIKKMELDSKPETKKDTVQDKKVIKDNSKPSNNNTKQDKKPEKSNVSKPLQSKPQPEIKQDTKDKTKHKGSDKPKETPTPKTPVSEKIKTKYQEIKENCKINVNKNKTEEKKDSINTDYNNLIDNDDNSPPVNNYIQTKPRSNARKYMPQFDSSVNDM